MYIGVSFPRLSSSPRLGILVHWLPIDPVLLTEPSYYGTGKLPSDCRKMPSRDVTCYHVTGGLYI
jgi:hypothetical protein